MMVIMQEAATEEQVARVVARVEAVGASAHVSAGERVIVQGQQRVRAGIKVDAQTLAAP